MAISCVLSFAPVAVLVALLWHRLSLHFVSDELILFGVAVVIVTLLVPVTRDLAGQLLDRYVYRSHANYRRTVREASGVLTRILDLTVLLPFVNRTITASTGSEGSAIYQVTNTTAFRRAHAEVRQAGSTFATPIEAPRAVIDAMSEHREPLVRDEIVPDVRDETSRALQSHLDRLNWVLVLPITAENVLIGIIAIGPKLSGDPFYPEDLDLLTTLANQAGIAVRNAQLYAEVVLANEYIENIVATIKSGVVAMDASGTVTMFNPAAERLTALSGEETKGFPVDRLPACLVHALRGAVEDGQVRTEPEIAMPGGDVTRPVICTTSPLRHPSGAVLGAVAVFSDLTPLKQLEQERRKAERLAYFEVLASGIAHEIKNPLVAIKTFAQLVPRRHRDAQFLEHFEPIVTREIAGMERLVERLRTLSRPADRPRRPLDLRAPITEVLELLQPAFEQRRLATAVDLGSTPAVVLGDEAELKELFMNLLVNAQEATPPDGTVSVQLVDDGERIAVDIADSGPGIAPEVSRRIFDPFFTTKQRGSGLGLSICQRIAEAHQATLRAANRPTGGAVFTVALPLAAGVPVGSAS